MAVPLNEAANTCLSQTVAVLVRFEQRGFVCQAALLRPDESGRDISLSHISKDQHLQKVPLGSTPPDRHTPLLPSPPSTTERPGGPGGSGGPDQLPQRLIHFKRQLETGQEVKAYAKFKLSRQRYSQLRSRIEQSFRRFDYEPERERLIVRMPSAVHDIFSTSLANEVTNQLRSVDKRNSSTAHFVSQIVSGASSEIDLDGSNPGGPGPRLSRQPDQQFQHKKAVFPGVVLEISYAQDGKQLGKLAQSYILESNCGIRAVVGIDINYRGSQPSTVSLWRARLSSSPSDPQETVLEMVPVLNAVFIDEAEEVQKSRKRKDREAVEPTPPTKKVKLFPSSPPQALSSSSSDDTAMEERALGQDPSFESPNTKRKA
ncbi:hypothetical protein CEP51_016187 [Fusarium floridanum]|uniref:Uncharacterized protein n=1 Tax=Fusarium floridanum TaxID=1325733 RepID=A0A428NVA4_9HYPO|nr:hypothetical protein CEP51_016187 [Fusarium floridanum]